MAREAVIEAVCRELHNWFTQTINAGTFEVKDGKLTVTGAQDGQYIRIIGSVFNDGVYVYPASGLTDETYDGAVWLMAIPPEVLQLAADIKTWSEDNDKLINSPYTAESFDGYSYSKESGEDGSGLTWQTHFMKRLNAWRKL